MTKKIAILFSGTGTNLENLLRSLHNKTFGGTRIEAALLLCNKKGAAGIERARKYGLESVILSHDEFQSREDFDKKMVEIIKERGIDLCVLAGFMRILTPYFTKNVRAINVHPSLLPAFKGAHAIKESFEAGVLEAGVSVHWVNEELDGGEIIGQKSFKRTPDMSYEEFEAKIHAIEYEILPRAVISILCEKTKG